MSLSQQLAGQFREVYLHGDWIATNLKTQLSETSWEQATTRIGSLHPIAELAYHVHYYVAGVLKVLEGGALEIRDIYSFDLPPITSQAEWEAFLSRMWQEGERFATYVAQLPEAQLDEVFVDPKYGTYYRNIAAMIEHSYYHLGQIVLLKKLLPEEVDRPQT